MPSDTLREMWLGPKRTQGLSPWWKGPSLAAIAILVISLSAAIAGGGGAATAQGNDDDDGVPPDNGDGYTDSEEAGTPLCGNGVNDDDKTGAGLVPDDAVVDDGCPGGPAQAGVFSEAQFKIGTDPNVRCGAGNEGTGVPSAARPSDLYSGGFPNSTDRITVVDIASFLAPVALRRLDSAPGQPKFNPRWDLSPGRGVFNSMINVTDLTSLLAKNTKGYPPMLPPNATTPLTTMALNGPDCTD